MTNLWKLLTINFRNKYFHNSVEWSGLYLPVYIPSWLAIHLIFNPPINQSANKFLQSNLSSICNEKLPSILYGARHYGLPPLENLVEVYPSIFARKCRIKLANILNLAKKIVRQWENKSVSLCIIWELECSQLKPLRVRSVSLCIIWELECSQLKPIRVLHWDL